MSRIKSLRETAGISRAELSKLSEVPVRTLEDWESERRLPRDVYQLAKVAKVLNCRIEDLIERVSVMKKYIVENATRNAAQIAGEEPYDAQLKDNYVGDYIEADSEAEAIEFAKDYICEHGIDAEYERDGDSIYVLNDDGEKVEEYFNFSAKECAQIEGI